jgi:hypothetical protein
MKRVFAAALLFATSLAFGATLNPIQLLSPSGSTSGQAIVSTGASTAPAWSNVTASGLVAQAANTVVANATGSSASPIAFAMPSCSASGNNLQWTSGAGFTCATGYALTGSPLSQFAATTSAQLAGVISDETGSGSLVFGTSPTIATPTITGVTNGSTAAAGSVGENLPAAAAGVSLTNSTPTNVTSISLAAGNWMVGGECYFIPAGSTSVLAISAGANTTSATLPSVPLLSQIQANFLTGAGQAIVIPTQFFNPTTTTTVFMVAFSTFSVSTMTVTCTIWKLRIR